VWLTHAKVTFTCTSCPKKGTRNLARFEPPIDTHVATLDRDRDSDPDLDGAEVEDIDDADIDLGDEDLDANDDL